MKTLREILSDRQEFLAVRVDFKGLHDTINIMRELDVPDGVDLTEHMSTLPGLYAFWSAVLHEKEAALATAELEFDKWFSPLYEEAFQQLYDDLGKKPNISSAENSVKQDKRYEDEYQQRKRAVARIVRDIAVLKSVVKAFEMKKDMLVQIGFLQRHLEPRVYENASTRNSQRQSKERSLPEKDTAFRRLRGGR